MTDIHPSVQIMQLFELLFQSLSKTWSEKNLEVPRMFVDHNEGGEAIDELIAIGLKNRLRFTAEQVKQIEILVDKMEMTDLVWVKKLRDYANVL